MSRDELRYWEDRVSEALVDEFDSPDEVDTAAFRCDPTVGCLRWLERVLIEKRAALSAPAWSASERKIIADTLRIMWSFSEGQQHTHSWHDREDFMEWLLGRDTDGAARVAGVAGGVTPPPLPTTEDQA